MTLGEIFIKLGLKSETFEKGIEKNGNVKFANEMLYAAAQAYCMMNKTKENFSKDKLVQAISMSSQDIQDKLMKTWFDSMDKSLESDKKKAQRK